MKKYVHDEIYKIIPNRYPLMLLDSLTVKDNMVWSEVELREDMWFFACHYPNHPIMPLSLILESMTQTFSAAFLSKLGGDGNEESEIPVIVSIGNIRLKESAIPGDRLKFEANLLSFRRGIAKGVCKAYKNNGEFPILEIEIVEALPSHMVKMS